MTEKANPDYQVLLKRSLRAIEDLESKLDAAERSRSEPIAIVGIGCRFPGGANDPESFWKLLIDGVDAVTEVPPERWDAEKYFDPDPDAVGKTYARWGAFLKDVDRFDADFFGISPREAVGLDPQQRLLLEVSWEALEHAGIAPAALVGSQTAVYIGITTQDYAIRQISAGGSAFADAYSASGTAGAMASGRLAYTLGLHGPNVSMDTACSSSLVALHWGVQSLRLREADLALAGGVNLTLTPDGAIVTARARMMSFTGRCHTFDAAADGYVRGEGCGMLVLKRLSDAQRDGDRVLALIRGSALNQDGRSSGLTAPNGPAQEAVIRAALANARLTAADISYVEAHGTGTSLGDPIEVRALGEVFGSTHSAAAPLHIASVKTNIGHLEGAAGMAGIIKTVLALQHRTIPAHLHLAKPNPHIPWERYPIVVPTTPTPWTSTANTPRRAGVSAFGFSGTNGHAVLEEAPQRVVPPVDAERPQHLLVLSAQTPDALSALAGRFAAYLEKSDAAPLGDVAMTAAMGRSHFSERLAVVAASASEARQKLASVAAAAPADQRPPGTIVGRAVSGAAPEIVFVFTGQGAQYPGMARQLYDTQPTFRRVLDHCAQLLEPALGEPLLPVVFGEGVAAERLDDTAFTQPALFAVEYALAQLWQSWGIEPTAVLGHSVGEYVAACVAGVFSLEDGLRLIAARGRLMSRLPRDGAMAAVFADESRVRTAIAGDEARLAIAAVNGLENTVISGHRDAVDAALARLAAQGVEWQALNVSHAFHSPLMDPMLDEFEAVARSVAFASPRIGLVSNVTGRLAGDEVCTAAYWRRHIREAVRFSDSIATLDADGYRTYLEIGPSPTLLGMARRCLPPDRATLLPSLRKGKDDWTSMLDSLGQLYVRGAKVQWAGFDRDYAAARQRATLPTYPFQRQRYWKELPTVTRQAPRPATKTKHPLLQEVVPGPLETFESRLSVAAHAYLADHRIFDMAPFPAAGFLEVALAAGREVMGSSPFAVQDVTIHEALVLPPEGDALVRVALTPAANGARTFHVFSLAEDTASDAASAAQWRLHASGTLASGSGTSIAALTASSIDALRQRCPRPVSVDDYYAKLANSGAAYGPTFRGIVDITRSAGEVMGRIELPRTLAEDAKHHLLHPALLDACFQLIGVTRPGSENRDEKEDIYVPISVGGCRVALNAGPVMAVWCHVTLRSPADDANVLVCDAALYDDTGAPVATVTGVTFQRVDRQAANRAARERTREGWIYDMSWRAVPPGRQGTTNNGRWLILTDGAPLGHALAARLRTEGADVSLVHAGDTFGVREDGWQVRPTESEDLRRAIVASGNSASATPLHGIVSLWGSSRTATGAPTLSALEASHGLLLAT
ncbi:MAG TPA: type I polyketide synthase, partial [Gemmatimonadaceae bacterium]